MSLRLGVACAVIDDEGRVLLSHRDDLNVWNLPGGRLDSGEALDEAAAREVREETGVIAHVERPATLSYWVALRRLNVWYTGWPLGGQMLTRTDETRDNRYFSPDNLPKILHGPQVRAVLANPRVAPHVIAISPDELRRLKRRLGLRWVQNLLRGRPEPRYPHFDVRAVAVIWDERFRRVVTLEGRRGQVLPRVVCSGMQAPWVELTERVKQHCRVNPTFQWVGMWQDAPRNKLELVFAAAVPEKVLPTPAAWTSVLNTPLGDRDLDYVERVRPTFATDPVWTLAYDDALSDDGILIARDVGV
ncbi:MAG: NUDIX domain-containing protein [Anaerolineae bacterium]|nr:NUDIX domain-containing protein [Anaerolineae bacterium]